MGTGGLCLPKEFMKGYQARSFWKAENRNPFRGSGGWRAGPIAGGDIEATATAGQAVLTEVEESTACAPALEPGG